MKIIQSLLILLLTVCFSYGQQNLPKGLTEEEKNIYQDYILHYEYGNEKSITPPSAPPRTPAEFEEAGGLIITWTSYNEELREIVRHAKDRVPVYIVSNSPSNLQSYLNNGGVDMENITILNFSYNSVWVRDFGPQSVYLADSDELAFVDWVYNRPRPDDNLIPSYMADYLGLPIFQMTTNPNRLVATGGNFMTDGHGAGFSSKLILTENSNLTEQQIDDIMYNFKGIDRYIKMDELPYDNISHLDMHMKLLDEETLLVAEFPQGVSDGPYIEANLDYLLNNHMTAYDRSYDVVRIPMVPNSWGNYPPNSAYRTFTNSLILNDLVLMPEYNNSALNQEALSIYQQAMPGYEIIGINMENVIGASGAIHCITREIAAHDPILIAHAAIRNMSNFDGDYPLSATIKNANGITSASVFYKTADADDFQELVMEQDGDHFTAIMPAQPCNSNISYYISASNENKTITRPFTGAEGAWTFQINDGKDIDFNAEQRVASIEESIVFFFTGCMDDQDMSEATWHFGEDANPQTATGIEDISVTYSTEGHKTVSLTIDGEEIIKENFILITEQETRQLTIAIDGQGQTTPAPGTYHFPLDQHVELTAEAAQGWVFDRWEISSMDDAQEEPAIEVEMVANITATAFFNDVETTIPSWESKFLFDIFPNPAQGRFNIVMSPSEGPVTIEVFNTAGQRVYNDEVIAEYWDQRFPVDLGEESTGFYIVKITWEQGSKSKRLILQ